MSNADVRFAFAGETSWFPTPLHAHGPGTGP